MLIRVTTKPINQGKEDRGKSMLDKFFFLEPNMLTTGNSAVKYNIELYLDCSKQQLLQRLINEFKLHQPDLQQSIEYNIHGEVKKFDLFKPEEKKITINVAEYELNEIGFALLDYKGNRNDYYNDRVIIENKIKSAMSAGNIEIKYKSKDPKLAEIDVNLHVYLLPHIRIQRGAIIKNDNIQDFSKIINLVNKRGKDGKITCEIKDTTIIKFINNKQKMVYCLYLPNDRVIYLQDDKICNEIFEGYKLTGQHFFNNSIFFKNTVYYSEATSRLSCPLELLSAQPQISEIIKGFREKICTSAAFNEILNIKLEDITKQPKELLYSIVPNSISYFNTYLQCKQQKEMQEEIKKIRDEIGEMNNRIKSVDANIQSLDKKFPTSTFVNDVNSLLQKFSQFKKYGDDKEQKPEAERHGDQSALKQ